MATSTWHLQATLTMEPLTPLQRAEQERDDAIRRFYENDTPDNFHAKEAAERKFQQVLKEAGKAVAK